VATWVIYLNVYRSRIRKKSFLLFFLCCLLLSCSSLPLSQNQKKEDPSDSRGIYSDLPSGTLGTEANGIAVEMAATDYEVYRLYRDHFRRVKKHELPRNDKLMEQFEKSAKRYQGEIYPQGVNEISIPRQYEQSSVDGAKRAKWASMPILPLLPATRIKRALAVWYHSPPEAEVPP